MKEAILIQVDGTKINVLPTNGSHFSYEELREFVCPLEKGADGVRKDGRVGLIEIVSLPSGKMIVCNEEGKLLGFPKNEEATKIWKEEFPIEKYPYNNDELIVGDVLVTDAALLER